ncbi:hypothetical protein G9A89_003576 [Geosiphon pyriformis]|nr:hypothetical protein G9A89_003576 [Geosiphon pyriformis]
MTWKNNSMVKQSTLLKINHFYSKFPRILTTILYLVYFLSLSTISCWASPIEKRGVGSDASQQNSDNASKITVHSTILGILLIALGFVYCFFGRRFFRVTIFILGFYIGSIIAWVILTNAEPSKGYGKGAATILLVVSLVFGLLIGLLAVCCADFAVYMLGGLGGYVLAIFILAWGNDGIITSKAGRIIFILAFIIAGVILTMLFKNILIILSTSLIGAYSIILGIDIFARTGFKESVRHFMDGNHGIIYHASGKVYGLLVALLVLFIAGSVFQWRYHRGHDFGYRNEAPATKNTIVDIGADEFFSSR